MATRAGVHVDRTACAWLIRRFIDRARLDVIVRGLSQVVESDEQMLALTGRFYDGLYEYRWPANMLGREPS